jgi:hypothetical protein
MAEMALAVVLLVGAGLLIRSFAKLAAVDPGFKIERALTFELTLPDARYEKEPQQVAYFDQLLPRLRAIPGVQSAGAVDEPKEVLLWAAHYAASTKGRGRDRVGIGSAGSWANLTWDAAVRKMRLLGEVARLATMPPSDELARSLDPKAVSSRRAALGHDV